MKKWFVNIIRAFFGAVVAKFVPAVTSADLTTLSDLLKRVYDPVIQEQQNLEAFTFKEFEPGEDKLGGDGWYFDTKMGGNQEGIGARLERGTLPSAGRQRYKQGKIYWKNLYGTFELTGQVIEAAKSNLHAFAVARTEEIEGLTRDLIKDFNGQIYRDGGGVLAQHNGTEAANTFNVNNAQYLRINMMIDMWTGNTKNLDSRQITGITANSDGTATVTYDGADAAASISSTDLVIREDNATLVGGTRTGTGSVDGLELDGFKKIVDDGTTSATYLNITRSSYPLFKGQLLSNSGTLRNLTIDLMQQAQDAIWRATNRLPNWIRMGLGQRRKYFDLLSPDKRYLSQSLDGGYAKLDFNGSAITVDVDHPLNEITFLTKETIKKYELRRFGLLDFDGLVLRQVSGQDLWRGYIGMYANLASKQPNANARITDLVEPTQTQWVW